jgi:hypothetical protein
MLNMAVSREKNPRRAIARFNKQNTTKGCDILSRCNILVIITGSQPEKSHLVYFFSFHSVLFLQTQIHVGINFPSSLSWAIVVRTSSVIRANRRSIAAEAGSIFHHREKSKRTGSETWFNKEAFARGVDPYAHMDTEHKAWFREPREYA